MDYLWIIYGYGWWLSHPSEKYESQLGGRHSQDMEKQKMFQTTNQEYKTVDKMKDCYWKRMLNCCSKDWKNLRRKREMMSFL